MRTNPEVERDVLDELAADPEATTASVTVRIECGIISLSGFAPTYSAKMAASRAAERVAGVRAVLDEIVVVPPSRLRRTDDELAAAITSMLHLNIQVPRNAVRFSVAGGWVTLEGTVRSQAERCAAESSVAVLAGVRGIVNDIVLDPPACDQSPIRPIESALRRSAELDCKHIAIQATPNGQVTLDGMVRSWAERRDAERAAWSAPGIRTVTNRLVVTS